MRITPQMRGINAIRLDVSELHFMRIVIAVLVSSVLTASCATLNQNYEKPEFTRGTGRFASCGVGLMQHPISASAIPGWSIAKLKARGWYTVGPVELGSIESDRSMGNLYQGDDWANFKRRIEPDDEVFYFGREGISGVAIFRDGGYCESFLPFVVTT